jgi:hypothetical protein
MSIARHHSSNYIPNNGKIQEEDDNNEDDGDGKDVDRQDGAPCGSGETVKEVRPRWRGGGWLMAQETGRTRSGHLFCPSFYT